MSDTTEYRVGEFIYHDFVSAPNSQALHVSRISEADAMRSLGASVIIGDHTIERFRIRTRDGQPRVLITVSRPDGSLVHAFDINDLNAQVTEDVAVDMDDLRTYYASIGISISQSRPRRSHGSLAADSE